jgi:histidine ammonia-lyase
MYSIARAAGFRGTLSSTVVRGVMVLRLNGFLSGQVGVGPGLCAFIADRLNDGWSPVVPSGPYGAAGEIGPLAHLFQTFVGEGLVRLGAEEVPASEALARLGVEPLALGPKEGLALVNGSPFATALGLELADRFRLLLDTASLAAALALALTGSSARPYSLRIGELAADPAQLRVHARLSDLLAGEFELKFIEAVCTWTAESGEAAWQLFTGSDGPAKTGVAALHLLAAAVWVGGTVALVFIAVPMARMFDGQERAPERERMRPCERMQTPKRRASSCPRAAASSKSARASRSRPSSRRGL